ncbi:helix-turn-helix domain-containing protein [Paenibacillus algorifonticola]|uniref:helix-turn-helix domain-containing protein n=1 Tax=Paenibacillus algorifonticola TaxID=684063 RepID=UPI003D2BE47B
MLKSKYMRRLAAFCMVLLTIPILTLGGLSYFKAKGIIEDKVQQGNREVLVQTQLQVEQLLKTIDSSLIQFINRPLINQVVVKQFEPRDFTLINELSEELYKLQAYDTGIQNISLASLEQEWALDNSGFRYGSGNDKMKPLTNLAAIPELSSWVTDAKSSHVQLVKKLPINTLKNPTGLMVATIPLYRLDKLTPQETKEAATVIFDANYRQLTGLEGTAFTSADLDGMVPQLREAADREEGAITIKTEKGPIGLNYRISPYNGWVYVSFISIEQVTMETSVIGWYTALICTAVFLTLLAMSLFGTRKMYEPIRRVFESALDGEQALQGDELEVIGERIQSLKLSQSKLLGQLQGQTQQLKEFFVRKLLLGELSGSHIREKTQQFHYELDQALYCILTVQIDTFKGTRFQENDRDLLMFAVNNIVIELIPAELRFDPVVIGGNQVTLLKAAADEEDTDDAKNAVYAWAETVQSKVKETVGLSVSIGISRFHKKLNEATQAYGESVEALKYRIRIGEEAILLAQDVLPDQRTPAVFPEWIEKQLIEAIMIPDLEQAQKLLKEFLALAMRGHIHHKEIQMSLFRLLADLIREVQNAGEELRLQMLDERELFDQLSELKTVAETEEWFMSALLIPMVQEMSSQWDRRNRNISDQIKEIIHHEYEQDITLELCSARTNYHPNYLKTVFRKETGINFSEYLSQYRLSQAKKWLLETDWKIADISARIQYQNPQNFIRYFRKMEQMTPGEYRKKYRVE